MALAIHPFPGDAALTDLIVPPSADSRAFHEGLAAGRIVLQRCEDCGKVRWPLAPVCPYCGGERYAWDDMEGRGKVVSFVRYPRAHLPHFAKLVPYFVLCVELAEGPRLFGRLATVNAEPLIGMTVNAIIERWADGGHAPAFVCEGPP